MRVIGKIFGWCFSVFCVTAVLAYGFSFASMLFLFIGIASLPIKPIRELWGKVFGRMKWIRVLVLTILFCFACSVAPTIETGQEDTLAAESATESVNTTEEPSREDVTESEVITLEVQEAVVEEKDTVELTLAEEETEVITLLEEETQVVEELPIVEAVFAPTEAAQEEVGEFSLEEVPPYSGAAYATFNDNVPYFTSADMEGAKVSYESYSEFDSLGRCGVCIASIGKDIMPTEERGEIGSVRPSGWHTVKYNDIIEDNYLYNRCHLIGYQLAGENANVQNLITGTRYLNIEGMQPFENKVSDYVFESGNHVLYRVTPIFEGDDLVATGVLMEAKSVEDNGEGIQFNVFCYNVQPGIAIDYANGDSEPDGTIVVEEPPAPVETQVKESEGIIVTPTEEPSSGSAGAYAVNGKNGKIHMVGECPATGTGKGAMKQPVYFDTFEEAESYSTRIEPGLEKRKCGNCW